MSDAGRLETRALRLARLGWHVFPIRKNRRHPEGHMHWPNTRDPGHPRHLSTADPATVKRFDWSGECWIGLRPQPSRILAVDLDQHGDGDGLDTWVRWTRNRPIPDSPSQSSPRGRHLFFRARMPVYRTKIEGVDLIGKAGVTIDGPGYAWDEDRAPWEISLPDAPAWVLRLAMPSLTMTQALEWSRRQ